MQEVSHQILRESKSQRARERAEPLHPRCKKATKLPHAKLLCPLCVCRSLSVSPPYPPTTTTPALPLVDPASATALVACCGSYALARHTAGHSGLVAPHKIAENVDYVVVLFLFFVHQWVQRLKSTMRGRACANLDVTHYLIQLVSAGAGSSSTC